MAKAKSEPQDVRRPDDGARALSDVRIDAAHTLTDGERPVDSRVQQPEAVLAGVSVAGDLPASAQQLRTHAVQLADHLSTRQQELDRREAEINARTAELEESQRSARLWLVQHRSEVDDREAEWAKQRREAEVDLQHCHVSWERDYQDRLAALEKRERALSDAGREEREKVLASREEALRKRDEELAASAKRLQAQAQEHEQAKKALADAQRQAEEEARRQKEQLDSNREQTEQTLRQTLEALESRRKGIDRTQAKLDALHEEAEKTHRQLSEDRRRWQEHVEAERQLLAAERRREMEELEQKRLALRRRGEQVDRSRAALQRMREDLRRMHRETLEIRLASEELWVQLSETTPAAVANRLLEQLRAKLAEQYGLSAAELTEQKDELAAIQAELAEFHQKLVFDRQDFDAWATRRQAEIERKAADLVSRNELLDRQETDFRSRILQWQTERLATARDASRDNAGPADSRTVAAAG